MRRAPLIGLAAIALVAAEIAVFVAVVEWVGSAWALALLIAVSVVGGWLVPRQGIRAWRRFRAEAEAGRPPGRQATDGLVGLIAALLLAVPGFVTGAAGALLFVPPVRWAARGRLERSVQRRTSSAVAGDLFGPRRVRVRRTPPGARAEPTRAEPGPPAGGPPPVIEGEIVDGPS
jgi:UPF0716 protein FxsA